MDPDDLKAAEAVEENEIAGEMEDIIGKFSSFVKKMSDFEGAELPEYVSTKYLNSCRR